jgi:peptidoglycan hydrolase-like protein with peptidoglycan-binding domain
MTGPSWPLQRECNAFYGDPRGANGQASAKWERANLTTVKCPWVLRYSGRAVAGIRIHKKAAASLARVLDAIWDRVGQSQAEIDRIGMSVYGGGYNFRLMRGGSNLSMHSWGCAVDFDPARNGLGDKTPAMDRLVIEEFEREGWEWGGHWSRPDGMHFQAAWTRSSPPRLRAAPARPKPTTPAASAARGDPQVLDVQRRLKDMNYSPGGLDGLWGGMTAGAVSGFINDRNMGAPAPTSVEMFHDTYDDLAAELAVAESEGFKRPVAPERAEAKPADLATKFASVGASQQSKLWAWIVGIPSAITAFVKGVLENFEEALNSPILSAAKEFAADNVLLIALALVGASALIWWQSQRAETATVEAFREGRIS